MTIEHLRAQWMTEIERLREIARQAKRVRDEQRAFFGGDRSRERVSSSKREEKRLDTMLARHDELLEKERQGTLGGVG